MRILLYISLLFFVFFTNPLFAQNKSLELATNALNDLAQTLNYASLDIEEPIVADHYTSQGITHIYFQQAIDKIGIYGTSAAVHIKDGIVISANLQFLKGLQKRTVQNKLQIQAIKAVAGLAIQKNYTLNQADLVVLEANNAEEQKTTKVTSAGISSREIPMNLAYIEDDKGDLQLVWSIYIDEINSPDYKNFLVNAATGDIESEINLTISCNFGEHKCSHSKSCEVVYQTDQTTKKSQSFAPNSYNVFPLPLESPLQGSRSIVNSPWLNNTIASPNGWHQIGNTTHTTTLGNNVDAYEDSNNSNSPSHANARANGGVNLDFNHPLDLNGNPADYKSAAVTNLFYWSNLVHDVWYNYGFDEVSGNFQENNFNKGGMGGDNVYAEAQDGSGTCNANMATPVDGLNPRMQMYLCNDRDGDFDNGVIIHEYGHGISTRLTGGPSTSSCLNNQEQMGEGWSDFFAIIMTMKAGDTPTKPRPIGRWLIEDTDGSGIRAYPYTTNMAVNPMTYATIAESGTKVPHGVGSVWATMLWDVTWAMIDKYGWDANLYTGTGGNNRMMALVIAGLKLQPCSPGFVDGRDAILAADRLLYGGENQCLIWEAFARRGLGYSATQGSSNSKADGQEAFDLPPSCILSLRKVADKTDVFPGENIKYTITATNQKEEAINNVVLQDFLPSNLQFVSASNNATTNGQTITWPTQNLSPGQVIQETILASVRTDLEDLPTLFKDDLEQGITNWTVTTQGTNNNATWIYQNSTANSGMHAFHAPGTAPESNANLTSIPLNLTDSSELIFHHLYDIENKWDAGVVQISTNNGANWIDLGPKMTQNGYNATTFYGFNGFTGTSNTWLETKVDLSEYAKKQVLIRFQMRHDYSLSKPGWWIDDISVSHLGVLAWNEVQISNGSITNKVRAEQVTNIITNGAYCMNLFNANLNSPDIPSGEYRSSDSISSAGEVLAPSNVNFYAGDFIQLESGFSVEYGAYFKGEIEDCNEGGGTTARQISDEPSISSYINKKDISAAVTSLNVFPNPFNKTATIEYQLKHNGTINIDLYDITGTNVKTLQRKLYQEAGIHQIILNAEQLNNGAYWLVMRTDDAVLTKKVFLISGM